MNRCYVYGKETNFVWRVLVEGVEDQLKRKETGVLKVREHPSYHKVTQMT